ncbi:MAG TPA: potassium channel protein [Bryobacteraceae bacterium]|nr:potassium channel protein [Bryobacteraceae bacterium]
MPHIRRRLAVVAAAIVVSLLTGTAGFVLIEGYPVFDAFYMSLITVATVGYMEVHPLSVAGRVFNSVLILFGVTTLFLGVGAMAQTAIEIELSGYFPKRRMRKMIENLKDHYIVCGFGRVGRGAAAELKRSGVPFIIIDRSEAKVDRAMREGVLAALGDATLDPTLREVGIARARGLIAALATDADNLFLTISAKTLNPTLNVATRVVEEEAEAKFRRAGADAVFATYTITGSRLAQSILRPHVVQFLEVATMDSGMKVSIEQVRVGESSEFVSKSLRQMQLRREVGVIVLAIRRATGDMLFNPDPEAEIRAGDYLIAMGTEDQLAKMNQLMAEAHA